MEAAAEPRPHVRGAWRTISSTTGNNRQSASHEWRSYCACADDQRVRHYLQTALPSVTLQESTSSTAIFGPQPAEGAHENGQPQQASAKSRGVDGLKPATPPPPATARASPPSATVAASSSSSWAPRPRRPDRQGRHPRPQGRRAARSAASPLPAAAPTPAGRHRDPACAARCRQHAGGSRAREGGTGGEVLGAEALNGAGHRPALPCPPAP